MTDLTDDQINALLFKERLPAIAMIHSKNNGLRETGCWFGGEPSLPNEIE
ncbi:MAG: hypothetical protein ACFBWO_00765 [Paracoccaceae bacterium]